MKPSEQILQNLRAMGYPKYPRIRTSTGTIEDPDQEYCTKDLSEVAAIHDGPNQVWAAFITQYAIDHPEKMGWSPFHNSFVMADTNKLPYFMYWMKCDEWRGTFGGLHDEIGKGYDEYEYNKYLASFQEKLEMLFRFGGQFLNNVT